MSYLAQLLSNARNAAGLTQKEVADKFGWSTPQFVGNWERGKSCPPSKHIKKLAKIYNIEEKTLEELCYQYALGNFMKKWGR